MGLTALLALQRKLYYGFLSPLNPLLSVRFELTNLGPVANMINITPPRTTYYTG